MFDSTADYAVVKRTSLQIGQTFSTLFAYTQQYIENQLIPHLHDFITDVLTKYPVDLDSAAATQAAIDNKAPVYISKLNLSDPGFGKSNDDPFFGTDAGKPFNNGNSYRIYNPPGNNTYNDTIGTLNQFINGWIDALSNNEQQKVNLKNVQNYSFHAGSPISHTVETEVQRDTSKNFSFVVSGKLASELGFEVSDVGIKIKLTEGAGGGTDEDTTHGTALVNNFGFTLASDGTDDYFTVDVGNNSGNADVGAYLTPVFVTRAGESACPYEGATFTKYYNPGTPLNAATVKIEVPKFDVDTHEVDNVPESRPAVFNLSLRNESEAKQDQTYVLSYIDNNNIQGATIAVDGVSIGGAGRPIVVRYGETVNKVLTITKGPNAMNYDSIFIVWHSSCQYDPTGYQETIADTQVVAAHFIPSCSDINIQDPIANWRLNTKSDTVVGGIRYLPITIDKFDTTNALFDHVELQYKTSSSSTWQTAANWYADPVKLGNATGSNNYLITNPYAINYNFEMVNTQFPDQDYDLRAVSSCSIGIGAKPIVTYSDVVRGIKDMLTPRLFGNPEPGDGILSLGEDIKATFNEPIEAGLLSNNNFQVTGIRNGSQGDNSVSIRLDGSNDYLAAEFAKNFTGKSITAEMWMLPDVGGYGTLFSQGIAGNSMELAFTADKHLQVTIGSKKITSNNPVQYNNDWAHVALVYDNDSTKVSAFYNFKEVISAVSVPKYTSAGNINFGRSISSGNDFFKGKIHEGRVWSKTITGLDLQINSHTIFSGAESNLLAYYPMNEGEGNIAADKAHGSNAVIAGTWSTPPGKAVAFHGNGYVQMNTGIKPIDSSMDYTIELWFKASANQANSAIVSNGKGDGTDYRASKNNFFLGFENGLLTYQSSGIKVQAEGNYLDDNWHHVAVTVNHVSGAGQLYVDGVLAQYFNANDVGGITSPVYLGVREWQDPNFITVTNYDHYLTGSIDEFRIWNTYMNQTLIKKNSNVRLNGDESGLRTYYPFDIYRTSGQGVTALDTTWQDLAVKDTILYAARKNAPDTSAAGPIKNRGPVVNLAFNYVVNNDAIIINMLEQKAAIDKTVVTFSVAGAYDKNGNPMSSPVTWTAYIDQAQLKWGDDELNLEKVLNAPMQFETYIENKGGTLQHFRLNALPVWLTADVTSGTINPQGKQKIVFTINQSLNIGVYNEIVYMNNDNNETEGLGINVTVKGKQPNWVVNPGDYKYNMSVYGKIRINNIFSSNAGDILAVFANGKCAGVTHNTYSTANNLWYAFLTVYSDSVKYNNLEFRIWNATTGITYQAVPSQAVNFISDAVIGTSANPVIFDGKNFIYEGIDLIHGWNWISLNVAPANPADVGSVLNNGTWASGDIIKNNDLGFDQYSSASGWVGYLPALNNTSMFMLKTANAQNLNIAGAKTDVTQTAVPLKGGRWNYISFLPQVNMSVKQALAGYNATDQDVIKSQTGFAMYDAQNGWIGDLSYLEPGKGYMLYRKSTADTGFNYPESAIEGLRNGSLKNYNQTPVAGNFMYAENMTVIAEVDKAISLQPGDILLANIDDEVRGKAKLIHNAVTKDGAFFLNIAGQNKQVIYFTIQRHGKIIAISDAVFTFQPDNSIGTLSAPLVIHFDKHSNISASAYPNPFVYDLAITVKLPSDRSGSKHEVYMSVYSSTGQLILSRGKEESYGSIYQTKWNGETADGSACAAGVYFIHVIIDGKLFTCKAVKN